MTTTIPIPTNQQYEIVFWRNEDEGEDFGIRMADSAHEAAALFVSSMREEHGEGRFAAAMMVAASRRRANAPACHFTALIEAGEIIAWWNMAGELQAGDESDEHVLAISAAAVANPYTRDVAAEFNKSYVGSLIETYKKPLVHYGLAIDPSDDEDNVPADALGIAVFARQTPMGSVSVINLQGNRLSMPFVSGQEIYGSLRRVLATDFPADAEVVALMRIDEDGRIEIPEGYGDMDKPAALVPAGDGAGEVHVYSNLAEDDEVARAYFEGHNARVAARYSPYG